MQYMTRQKPLSTAEKQLQRIEKRKREAELKLKNRRLGVLVFQVSWIMVFIALLVSYWQLGFSEGWRPDPGEAPNAILPTLATLALLASGYFVRKGWKTAETTDPAEAGKRPFLGAWLIAIGLGVAFLLAMTWAFWAVPADDAHRFGMIYRLMIGFHAVHAVVIGVLMVQVWRLSRDGRYHAENSWALEGTAQLWYFVIVAWLLFYPVLYLPYLL